MKVLNNFMTNRHPKQAVLYAALCGLVLTTLTHTAKADTLLAGNLGPGNSYQTGTGNSWANGGTGDSSNAVSFTNTTGQAFTLTSIQFADNWFEGNDTLNIEFLEGSDLNSATLLESFSVSAGTMFDQDLYTVTSVTNPLILPGETYYIAQSVPDSLGDTTWGWQYNNTGETGYFSQTGSDPWFAETGDTPAFAVYASPAVSTPTIPEPSSFLLLGTGLAAVTHLRRKFNRS